MSDPAPAADGGRVNRLVDHLFRHQSGRMVAALAGLLGPGRLQLAEDVVQDSLVRAMRLWPFRGVPERPVAWLYRVARNLALDALRHDKVVADRRPDLEHALTALAARADDPGFAAEITDAQLRLMFACCHPEISADARITLTLKTVGGFGVREIAAAFLTSETAMAQRLVRGKRQIRRAGITLHVPPPGELTARLGPVLDVVYLMFNEGYSPSGGDLAVRRDICGEALRLGALICRHQSTGRPQSHALMALMMFHAARLDTRVDDAGEVLLLADQDRSQWDQDLTRSGLRHLAAAMHGTTLSRFHLLAGIAACHATATTFEATDWNSILNYYTLLAEIDLSPITALNRAVALAMVDGPEAGLAALEPLAAHPALAGYYLLPATRGAFLERLARPAPAAAAYRTALNLAPSLPTRRFLARRIERVTGAALPPYC